jgi:hypothetical protein
MEQMKVTDFGVSLKLSQKYLFDRNSGASSKVSRFFENLLDLREKNKEFLFQPQLWKCNTGFGQKCVGDRLCRGSDLDIVKDHVCRGSDVYEENV